MINLYLPERAQRSKAAPRRKQTRNYKLLTYYDMKQTIKNQIERKNRYFINAIFSGTITEREIITLKGRINNGDWTAWDLLTESNKSLKITAEQAAKGINWLKNQYKTTTGRIRKNNPFNDNEIQVINNFSRFTLIDFMNVSNYFPFYVPVYRCIAKDGSYFDYYTKYGEKFNRY